MADMRRRSPEPPPGAPQIQHKPGLANEMLRELAPLLAEEGIDVDDIDVPDLETLQAAMNRAVECRGRHFGLRPPEGPWRAAPTYPDHDQGRRMAGDHERPGPGCSPTGTAATSHSVHHESGQRS